MPDDQPTPTNLDDPAIAAATPSIWEDNRDLFEIPNRPARLGRHVRHDRRSRGYPSGGAATIISVKHTCEPGSMPMDQGQIGSCTANALVGALNLAPDFGPNSEVRGEDAAKQLYGLETQIEGDPWPPNDPGGSGLMVCKAARQLGWIGSYWHAFGLDHALRALVQRPVIFGVAWYDSMFEPDPETGEVTIAPGANVSGGHEIVADEIDAPGQLVGFWNSWGAGWGLGGRFYLSYSTLDELLRFGGDATVPLP